MMQLTELDRKVRTMPAILREQACRCGDQPFLMFGDRRFTFSKADPLVDDYATGLRNIGVERSTLVAIMMENSPEYLWVCLALGRLDAVGVPLNTAYKGTLLRHALRQASVCVVLIGHEFLERLEVIESDLPPLRTIVVNGPGDSGRALGSPAHSPTSRSPAHFHFRGEKRQILLNSALYCL